MGERKLLKGKGERKGKERKGKVKVDMGNKRKRDEAQGFGNA